MAPNWDDTHPWTITVKIHGQPLEMTFYSQEMAEGMMAIFDKAEEPYVVEGRSKVRVR